MVVGDRPTKRHDGPKHEGPRSTAPYGDSTLSPAYELVDIARQIEDADKSLSTRVHAKLEFIVDQIRYLQEKAQDILEEARDDAILHRATCRFERRVGHTYHLYQRGEARPYFSLLSPSDWGDRMKDAYLASYKLEPDLTWSRVDAHVGESKEQIPRLDVSKLVDESPSLLPAALRRSMKVQDAVSGLAEDEVAGEIVED